MPQLSNGSVRTTQSRASARESIARGMWHAAHTPALVGRGTGGGMLRAYRGSFYAPLVRAALRIAFATILLNQ